MTEVANGSAMTREQMKSLHVGDIVRHISRDESYVVTENYGDRVTAVRSMDITNAAEWVLVAKATQRFVMSQKTQAEVLAPPFIEVNCVLRGRAVIDPEKIMSVAQETGEQFLKLKKLGLIPDLPLVCVRIENGEAFYTTQPMSDFEFLTATRVTP